MSPETRHGEMKISLVIYFRRYKTLVGPILEVKCRCRSIETVKYGRNKVKTHDIGDSKGNQLMSGEMWHMCVHSGCHDEYSSTIKQSMSSRREKFALECERRAWSSVRSSRDMYLAHS